MKKRKNKINTSQRRQVFRTIKVEPTTNYQLFIDELEQELNKTYGCVNRQHLSKRLFSTFNSNNYLINIFTIGDTIDFLNLFKTKFHPVDSGVCLFDFYVDPKFRNKGLGKLILETIRKISERLNIPVYLIPIQTDTISIDVLRKLYHSFGFNRESDSLFWIYEPTKKVHIPFPMVA